MTSQAGGVKDTHCTTTPVEYTVDQSMYGRPLVHAAHTCRMDASTPSQPARQPAHGHGVERMSMPMR